VEKRGLMTLIVSYMSHDYAVLVSDRRITWLVNGQAMGWQDIANKTIVLASHVIMGYAGFAELSPGVETDRWAVQKLAGAPTDEYFNIFLREVQSAVAQFDLPSTDTHHAFIGVGFLPVHGKVGLQPVSLEISNLGGEWREWTSGPTFSFTPHRLAEGESFGISAVGIVPPKFTFRDVYEEILAYKQSNPGLVSGIL
jgi:hypothetical protein